MNIRLLEEKDIVKVSELCIRAFLDAVAPSLSDEGIETFRCIASVASIRDRMDKENRFLVCEENGAVIGVVEIKEGRHVAMLFVSPEHQKKGVGRALVYAIQSYITEEKVSVSASISSVPAYLKYGFRCVGLPDEKSGLKYQPMELKTINKQS